MAEQWEEDQNKVFARMKKHRLFGALWLDAAVFLAEDRDLTKTDHRMLWALIGSVKSGNVSEYTISQLEILLRLPPRSVFKSLRTLEGKGYIHRFKKPGCANSWFHLNPEVFWRGRLYGSGKEKSDV